MESWGAFVISFLFLILLGMEHFEKRYREFAEFSDYKTFVENAGAKNSFCLTDRTKIGSLSMEQWDKGFMEQNDLDSQIKFSMEEEKALRDQLSITSDNSQLVGSCAVEAMEKNERRKKAYLKNRISNHSCPNLQFLALQLVMNEVVSEGFCDERFVSPALYSWHPAIRGSALLVLGRMKAFSLIAGFLDDIDDYVRNCAVSALGMCPDLRSDLLEERILLERSEEVLISHLISVKKSYGIERKEAWFSRFFPENVVCLARQITARDLLVSESPTSLPGAEHHAADAPCEEAHSLPG